MNILKKVLILFCIIVFYLVGHMGHSITFAFNQNENRNYFTLKQKYVKLIEKKYGKKLNNLSKEKIKQYLKKINKIRAIIVALNIPEDKKVKYSIFLSALEEVLLQILMTKTTISEFVESVIETSQL